MLERPKYGELPEAEEADRLSAGEVAQTPDVKPVCQRPPIIISQSVDIPEHADDRCGYGRLVVAEEAAEDEVGNPLTIPQLRRELLYLPPQEVPQITDLQGRKILTHNGGRVINACFDEFRSSAFSNDHTQVIRVTVIWLGVQEDLAGAGATLRPLNDHFHRDRLVDPVDGFHRGELHTTLLTKRRFVSFASVILRIYILEA